MIGLEPETISAGGTHRGERRKYAEAFVPLALVVLCETALATGPLLILRTITQDPAWLSVASIVFAAAAIGVPTIAWISFRAPLLLSPTLYRLSELVILFFVVRVGTWHFFGRWPDIGGWSDYLRDPLMLFDFTYLAALAVTVMAWERASRVSAIFISLAISETSVTEDPAWRYRNCKTLALTYMKAWLLGGTFLGLCAAALTFDLAGLFTGGGGLDAARPHIGWEMALALFLYFICGIWLLGHVRLAALKEHWGVSHAKLQPRVPLFWHLSSLKLLLVAAVIAAILPGGLFVPLGGIVDMLWSGLVAIFPFLLLPVTALIAAIHWLVGGGGSPDWADDVAKSTIESLPLTRPDDASSAGDASFVVGSLLWLGLLFLLALSIVHLVRHRRIVFSMALLTGRWRSISDWITMLWRFTERATRAVRYDGDIDAPLSRESAFPSPPSPHAVVGLPQRQVRRAYLTLLQWCSEHGFVRRASMTPAEFVRELEYCWPDASFDAALLTRCFEKARYSADETTESEAATAARALERIRVQANALRSGN